MAREGEAREGSETIDLREEVIRLGPWHFDIEITPELSTRAFLDAPPGTYDPELVKQARFQDVGNVDPRGNFTRTMQKIFPEGLQGRSVLDCACNCGGLLFWAKELGAGRCFGFDVRERWIEQARFVARHRTGPGADVQFEVADLYDIPAMGLEPFDITLFNGIIYHLPEPTRGLRIAADLTKQLMVVSTNTITGFPDGVLVADFEDAQDVLFGVYGLRWIPTGPGSITPMLKWAGFEATRCNYWHRRPPQRRHRRSRTEVLGARDPQLFEHYDTTRATGFEHVFASVQATVPRGSIVLVANRGDRDLLRLGHRAGWPFPQDEDGAWAGENLPDSAAAIALLEELRAEGAGYLVIPDSARSWLEQFDGFRRHLEANYAMTRGDRDSCLIFALEPEQPHGLAPALNPSQRSSA
jgi:SAM-dependent methyltransferase